MDLNNFDHLEEALKTDGAILGIALFVLFPLSYLHGLFLVMFTLSLVYLAGSCVIYLLSAYRHENDGNNPS